MSCRRQSKAQRLQKLLWRPSEHQCNEKRKPRLLLPCLGARDVPSIKLVVSLQSPDPTIPRLAVLSLPACPGHLTHRMVLVSLTWAQIPAPLTSHVTLVGRTPPQGVVVA